MEFQKKYIQIIIILLINYSCTNNSRQSELIDNLKAENEALKEQAADNQTLLDSWFIDFNQIQEDINSINTEDVYLLKIQDGENKNVIPSDKDKMLEKVEKIKKLISQKEQELDKSGSNMRVLKTAIKNLKNSLEEKENIINSLKEENKNITIKNHVLESTNVKQQNEITNQNTKIQTQITNLNNLEKELKNKEIETYLRLSEALLSVSNKLPIKVKGWFTKQTEVEISNLRYDLREEAERYKNEAERIKFGH